MILSVKAIQVIEVVTSRGSGEPDDIGRWVTQYYSLDGVLLGENDPTPRHSEQPRDLFLSRPSFTPHHREDAK